MCEGVQGLLLILDRSGVFRRLGDSPSRVAGQWVVDRGKRRATASYQAEDSLGWPRHRMRVYTGLIVGISVLLCVLYRSVSCVDIVHLGSHGTKWRGEVGDKHARSGSVCLMTLSRLVLLQAAFSLLSPSLVTTSATLTLDMKRGFLKGKTTSPKGTDHNKPLARSEWHGHTTLCCD